MNKHHVLLASATLPAVALALLAVWHRASPRHHPEQPALLLTSFHEPNGALDGLHLSYSLDGLTWTALRPGTGKPILKPVVGDRILRDPSLCFLDERFHAVWTSSWGSNVSEPSALGFGYASSADLIEWSPQRFVRVAFDRPDAINVWAPELLCEADKASAPRVQLVFASMFSGETLASCERHPQRLFAIHTRDFATWTRPREIHPLGNPPPPLSAPAAGGASDLSVRAAAPAGFEVPPGASYIDAVVLTLPRHARRSPQGPGKYLLVYKDERLGVKALRASIGPSPTGPWSPLKPVGGWDRLSCAEGPTAFLRPGALGSLVDPHASTLAPGTGPAMTPGTPTHASHTCPTAATPARCAGWLFILFDRYRLDDCAHFCAGTSNYYGMLRCSTLLYTAGPTGL